MTEEYCDSELYDEEENETGYCCGHRDYLAKVYYGRFQILFRGTYRFCSGCAHEEARAWAQCIEEYGCMGMAICTHIKTGFTTALEITKERI